MDYSEQEKSRAVAFFFVNQRVDHENFKAAQKYCRTRTTNQKARPTWTQPWQLVQSNESN